MYRSLQEILKNDLFSNVEIIAGKQGLMRNVKRISVFDCPYKDDILNENIVEEGDLFISCLEQFHTRDKNFRKMIDSLILGKCCGLMVVNDDQIDILDDEIIKLCQNANFPILLIRDNIPYAYIMDAVNRYITIDNVNAINSLKIDKIMYGHESDTEKLDILHSINPNIQNFVRAIFVEGDFNSKISQMELYTEFLNKKNDIYVIDSKNKLFILSGNNEKAVKHNSDTLTNKLKGLIDNATFGFGRIMNRKKIAITLEEAQRALDTAKSMKIQKQEYDPLLVMQLLLAVKDYKEATDFYDAYVSRIKQSVSNDNFIELIKTVELYVAHSGNYTQTANIINQHENTVRYRINKVKQALGMENDTIKFYETIAIASKLRSLLGYNL